MLEIQHLRKSFGSIQSINGITCSIRPGEVVGVIGPNGAGKTTLVNLLTGFVKPTSGKIVFQGQDITRLPAHLIARKGIARTFQLARPYAQLTPAESLMVSFAFSKMKKELHNSWAHDLLQQVGFNLEDFETKNRTRFLSHGHAKRLELASCLALKPHLLIFDELFSGLSQDEVSSLIPLIEQYKVQGKTILMVEHRVKDLFRLVDRVLVLNHGQLILDSTPAEVIHNPIVKSAYFGSTV